MFQIPGRLSGALLAGVLLLSNLPAMAQQTKPETLIKWRQSVYQVMVWNMSRIRNNLDGPSFNRDEVVRASGTLANLAGTGIGSLFAPGTENGSGWKSTTVKPELFRNPQLAGELSAGLVRETAELARLATASDPAAIRSQYSKVGQACKACHDEFKVKE